MSVWLPKNASRARIREAENARRNRREVIKALSQGQITRRELLKWGLLTAGGTLMWKHGFNPFVRSAYASIPTGLPSSPLFGAVPFDNVWAMLRMPVTGVRSSWPSREISSCRRALRSSSACCAISN